MDWISSVNIPKSTFEINHTSKILTLGSCFADNMGAYLNAHKFEVLANPFGNVYNLISLLNVIESCVDSKKWDDEDFVERDELFFHYDFHTEIHAESKSELIEKINKIADKTRAFLKEADVVVFTLGTSWVFKRKSNDKIVANCHKQNATTFEKILLSVENQTLAFEKIMVLIKSINPNIQIISTVSPVRHIKDGLAENSISKAILRIVINQMLEKHENCSYFPSFEIMIDELRDYRFYDEDLIHPSSKAIAYISDKFSETYFSKKTVEICEEWTKIKISIAHRPLNVNSNAHQIFLNKLYHKVKDFSQHFDVVEELELIKQQII
jgi:lysophospholipase L1-like esterase